MLPPRPGMPAVRVDGRGVVSFFGVAFEIVEDGLSTKEVSVVLERTVSNAFLDAGEEEVDKAYMNVVSPSKSSL